MRERLLRPSVLLALGAGAALSPVTLHNWVRGNDPLLVASQGGINFYLGNNPEANGRSARAPVNWEEIPAEYRERHRDDVWSDRIVWASARYLAGKDLEREALRDSEISRYWFRKGLRFVWEDPLGFARLLLAKSYFLLNAYEIPSNKDMEFFIEDQRLGVLQALSLGLPSRFPAGVLLPLALLGVLFSWRQRSRWSLPYLFLVSQALVIVLFFVTARFRLPMVPLLALFAVAGVVGTIQAVNRGSTARRIGVAALALGLLALSQSRALQVRDPHLLGTLRYNLGNHYRERGQMERAEAAYLAAVEMAPELAVASYQLGNIHFDRREMDRAETRYRAALEARPTLSDALLNLGLVLQFRGDLPAAVEALRAGLRLQPDSTQGRFNLAVLLVEMDEPEEAAQQYAEALRLDPSYWAAAINLGNLRFRQGDYESALRAYEEALRQLPRNAQLHHDVGVTLSRLGRFEEAEASLRAALRLDPLRTETLRELSALRPRER